MSLRINGKVVILEGYYAQPNTSNTNFGELPNQAANMLGLISKMPPKYGIALGVVGVGLLGYRIASSGLLRGIFSSQSKLVTPKSGRQQPKSEVEDATDRVAEDANMRDPDDGDEEDDEDDTSSVGSTSTYQYQQEPFETYQFKAAQLCRDIGFGTPSTVQRMEGGSYNRVVGVDFASGQSAILRIPRDEDILPEEINDQVAIHHFLSQFEFLHSPAILAYDTTKDNALGSPYVLQRRLQGKTVYDNYYHLPIPERCQVASQVAETLIKMRTITLENPGRLVGSRSSSSPQHIVDSVEHGIEITGFRDTPISDLPPLKGQPLASLLIQILEARKAKKGEDFYGTPGAKREEDMLNRLQEIASEMESEGLIREDDVQNYLWHWDLSASNMLMQRDTEDGSPAGRWVITGVIDWDDAKSVPLVLTSTPPSWLWGDESERSSSFFGNRDKVPKRPLAIHEQQIKTHFDQHMERSCPTYMEDAYGRGVWLRRLFKFGLDGFSDQQQWENYKTFVSDWEGYVESRNSIYEA